MKNKGTFMLTAVNETPVKLPKIPTSPALRAIAQNNFTLKKPRLGTPRTQPFASKSQSGSIKDLLSTIYTDSEKYYLYRNIQDLFSTENSGVVRAIGKLEASVAVKEAFNVLAAHLVSSKTEYNRLCSLTKGLLEQRNQLEQLWLSANKEEGSSNMKRCEELGGKAKDIQEKIAREKLHSESLRHMLSSRRDFIVSLAKPVKRTQRELKDLKVKTESLLRASGENSHSCGLKQLELGKAQEILNSQRETMRELLNSELRACQDRSKAVTLYKQLQSQWYKQQAIVGKVKTIKELEKLQNSFVKQGELKTELAQVQLVLSERETYISSALQATNTNSLEDLGDRIAKLKETKESLKKAQTELELTLAGQSQETLQLNQDFDAVVVKNQLDNEYSYRNLYGLEEKFAEKEKQLRYKTESFNSASLLDSSILLGMNQLIHKISNEDPDPRVKSIRNFRDAVEYLTQKISEIANKLPCS